MRPTHRTNYRTQSIPNNKEIQVYEVLGQTGLRSDRITITDHIETSKWAEINLPIRILGHVL